MAGVGATSGRLLSIGILSILCCHSVVSLTTPYTTASSAETCTASRVERPLDVGGVQYVVRKARAEGQKVKVVGTKHASTDIVCTTGVALDLSLLNQVVINPKEMEAKIGTGATQERVLDTLAAAGFATEHPFIKYSGVTVGGVLATGSISSSLRHKTSISDQVTSVKLVDGLGELVTIAGEELNAVRVNLGYLGVIVEVTLGIVPNYKVRLQTSRHHESILFDGTTNQWARDADYFEIYWFPNVQTAIALNGTYVDINEEGNDRAEFVFTTTDGFIAELERASATRNEAFFCGSEAANAQGWITGHPGIPQLVNETGGFVNPATGLMKNILANSCVVGTCAWDNPGARFLAQEVQATIELERFPAAMKAVKNIMDRRPSCNVPISGITIRYQGASTNYLSGAYGSDVGHFEILQPLRQIDNESPYGQAAFQEIYQTLLLQFDGRSHWGKNSRAVFTDPFPRVWDLYPRWNDFLLVKSALDPDGIFENEFFERLSGTKELVKGPFCATDEKCVCSQNFHCARGQRCERITIMEKALGVCVG